MCSFGAAGLKAAERRRKETPFLSCSSDQGLQRLEGGAREGESLKKNSS